MNSITLLCVFALFLSLSLGFQMRPSSISINNGASPYNGTYPLGTLIPNRWNQTTISLPSSLSGVPLSSMWIFFTETESGKPLPGISFYRASLTLTTSNQDLSVYNALTSSLDVARTFPAALPYTIPAGNLSLKATFSIATATSMNVSIAWIFTQSSAPVSSLSHVSIFVPGWKASGEATGDITTNIPFDAVISWAVGNVLVGGQSVTLLNNATGAVMCSSVAGVSGDMPPCTLAENIPKGTKITVVVKSNSTGIANNGGFDIYLAKVIPTTTTTTVATTASTHAAATTASSSASSSHAAAASSSHAAASGPAATAAATSHAAATSAAATSHAAASTSHAAAATAAHAASTAAHAAAAGSGSGGHSGSGSGGHSGSGSGSGSGGHSGSGSGTQSSGSGSTQSSGSGTQSSGSGTQASSAGGVTMGYSSGGGSSSSSGSSGFLGGEGSIFSVKKELKHFAESPKSAAKAASAPATASAPRKMTLNDLKRKAMVIADDEVEDLSEKDKHFRVLEEKSSNKFL